ncbi:MULTISPECIES: hypothetical protein [Bacillaceae]|nr:hypothetical protein [Neobacillus bataviensis]
MPEEVYGVAAKSPSGVLTVAVILVIKHTPRLLVQVVLGVTV